MLSIHEKNLILKCPKLLNCLFRLYSYKYNFSNHTKSTSHTLNILIIIIMDDDHTKIAFVIKNFFLFSFSNVLTLAIVKRTITKKDCLNFVYFFIQEKG